MGVLDIAKRIFGKDEYDELDLELRSADGCKGEEIIAKIINKLRPC